MPNRQLILVVVFLSLVPLGFGRLSIVGDPPDVVITGFFSCDRHGVPMNFFPIKTTVYFHVSLRNFASTPLNITISVSVLDVTGVPVGMDQLNTTILSNSTAYYIMSVFLPKWTRLGPATAYATVFVEGEFADGETTQFQIGPEDLTPPTVTILSPENVTYSESHSVPLVFTVNERPFWMSYRLNEHGNITIEGNSTLASLVNGDYNLVVYVNDTSGNVGSSQVNFTVLVVHDVAVTDVQCSPPQVYVGQPVSISVSVQNEGTTSETFNVSVYANVTLIGTLLVADLPAGDDTTLPLTWNTAGTPKGNYTTKATAHPVLDEVDVTDNTYLDGTVNIMTRPDVSVTSVVCSKTVVGQGYSVQLNATVNNEGDRPEAFNTTVYANSTPLQTTTVNLAAGETRAIAFLFNTESFAKGNYTITVVASPIPDETDTADNTFVGSWAFITIPGDANADRRVDIFDLVRISNLYEISQTQTPLYKPNCDINGDGNIDIYDLTITASHYGEEW